MPTKTPKTDTTAVEVKKAPRASKKSDTNAEVSTANGKGLDANSAVAPARASKIPANAAQLTPVEIEHFQDLLLQERARLEEEREQIRSRSGSVDGALPEEGEGGDEDTVDLASAMMDKEMDLSIEDEIEDLLSQVAHALRKINDGSYGVCDISGEKIAKARLELIPWAALTAECQAIAEGQ